jgi:hypothetical protein
VLEYPKCAPEHHRTARIFLQLSLRAHRYVIDALEVSARNTAATEYVRTENKV